MKNWTIILKILAAVAAVAGIVYIIAAYGEKIVAFARRLLGRDYNYFDDCDDIDCEDCFDLDEDSAVIEGDLDDEDFEG